MTVKIYLWVIWELIWYPLVNREAYQLLTLSGAALDVERAEGEARKDREEAQLSFMCGTR